MRDTRQHGWRGFTIETEAVPVRHCAVPAGTPVTYVALVRISRAGELAADWHLPQYAQRWSRSDEAHRDALDYAVHAIDSGRLGEPGSEPGSLVGLAA